jgi:UDP-N-acetylmuramoyl-tripeptide--D-alanyl-D-alanine ligase
MLSAAVSRMPEGEKTKRGGIRQIGVGYSNSGVRISEVRQTVGPDLRPMLSMLLSRGETRLSCDSPVFGRQHARNIAYAYSASVQLGVDDADFRAAAAGFGNPPGRGVISRAANGGIIIDETYNANPTSLSAAVKNVLEFDVPADFRRIAVLGGMRELGAESARWHDVVLSRVSLLDEVYLIGGEWDGVQHKYETVKGVWRSADEFIADFSFDSLPKSVILLKGSNSYGLSKIASYFESRGTAKNGN